MKICASFLSKLMLYFKDMLFYFSGTDAIFKVKNGEKRDITLKVESGLSNGL